MHLGAQQLQLAGLHPRAHQRPGRHADAPAALHRLDIGLRRRHIALQQPRRGQIERSLHPLRLGVVLAVEDDEGHLRQMAVAQPARADHALDEGRAGHRDIAHGAQRRDPAAAQRLRQRRHAAQHPALAKPVMGEVLVVDDQLQRDAVVDQRLQRRQHPGRQAVGIDRDRHPVLDIDAFAQIARDIAAQRLQLARVAQQHLARAGEPQRARAHHQRLADLHLQRAQPLRHRALGDRQPVRGALEAAFIDQGGQAVEGGRVEHFHKHRLSNLKQIHVSFDRRRPLSPSRHRPEPGVAPLPHRA